MDEEPTTFRRSLDRGEALALIDRLTAEGLNATFHDNSSLQEALFIGSQQDYCHVLLPPTEFARVEEILLKDAEQHYTTA